MTASQVQLMELKGSTVSLREFTTGKASDPKYVAWLRDPELVISIGRLEYLLPLSVRAVESYVETLLSSGVDCFFAIHRRDTDDFIGTLRIGHINWHTKVGDVGIMIGDRNARGFGFSTDAVRTACGFAFGYLGLRRLTAGTQAKNTPMIRCFKRVGFLEEGRLRHHDVDGGTFQDHILFGLMREEFASTSTPTT